MAYFKSHLFICTLIFFNPISATENSNETVSTTEPEQNLLVYKYFCDGNCDKTSCPTDKQQCAWGVVEDPCGCCELGICGNGEGETCSRPDLNIFVKQGHGVCGEDLNCVIRSDLKETDAPEGFCTCANPKKTCGSDGITYRSVCALGHIAKKEGLRGGLYMKHWGPCKSAPVIVSATRRISAVIGSNLTIDCEVRGFPIPVVTWLFADIQGEKMSLPGDDMEVAVQARGGPEAYTSTSWVQISEISSRHEGVYTCSAANSEGVAIYSVMVKVYGL